MFIAPLKFSHNTQIWQRWHLIQMHQTIFKEWKRIHFSPKILVKMYIRLLKENKLFRCYTLGFVEKNDFLFVLWILSDAFELDANVVNFVYYGKTWLKFSSLYTPYDETSINMIKQRFHTSDRLVHIGITQTINATTGAEEWYWGSGQLIPTKYWAPGQPNRDTTQPVLSMIRESGGIYFYDTEEEDLRPYVCHQGEFIFTKI